MLNNFTVNMTPFRQDRAIRVYLPKSYDQSNEHYPVLYMHDGKNVFRDETAIGGKSLELEKYLDDNEMDVIVVGIDGPSTFEERVDQYCPWENGGYAKQVFGDDKDLGGKGKEYIQFVVEELKPLIDHKYRTLTNHTLMAGISLGALISMYAACRYPHIFSKIAGLSSAFWRNQEEIEYLVRTSDLSALEGVYLDCGTTETKDEQINEAFMDSCQNVFTLIMDQVPNSTFKLMDGAEHNYDSFIKRVPGFMDFLLEGVTKKKV